jgi:uncharacterized Fe-S cluster protein YjdI
MAKCSLNFAYQESERSSICVRGHLYVWDIIYMCERSSICVRGHLYVWEVIYMCEISSICVRGHLYVWEVIYMCERSSICVLGVYILPLCFYYFSIRICNCYDCVVFLFSFSRYCTYTTYILYPELSFLLRTLHNISVNAHFTRFL